MEQQSVIMSRLILQGENYEIYFYTFHFPACRRELDTPYNYSHDTILRVEKECLDYGIQAFILNIKNRGLIHKIQTFPKISFIFKDKPQLS